MMHGHAGLSVLWQSFGAGVLVLAIVAAARSRLVSRTVRYPVKWLDKSPPAPDWGSWIGERDDGVR
jgi:hypothetical protein